jgi:hypothetical protein
MRSCTGVDELEAPDLYHATNGGEAARKRRDDAVRGGVL